MQACSTSQPCRHHRLSLHTDPYEHCPGSRHTACGTDAGVGSNSALTCAKVYTQACYGIGDAISISTASGLPGLAPTAYLPQADLGLAFGAVSSHWVHPSEVHCSLGWLLLLLLRWWRRLRRRQRWLLLLLLLLQALLSLLAFKLLLPCWVLLLLLLDAPRWRMLLLQQQWIQWPMLPLLLLLLLLLLSRAIRQQLHM